MSIFTTIVTIVVHTPIWVWALYALLLCLGVQRTRDSIVSVPRMLILPVAVLVLAVFSVIGGGLSALPAVTLGFIVGGAAGWHLEPTNGSRRLPNGSIWLRGEWWTFGQLVLVLVFRYATSAASAMDPVLNANPTWHMGTLFISTTLSALFLGRTAARMRMYFASPATI